MVASKRWKNRPQGSTWGDFGPDDQLGRLNLLTPEKVKQGIAEVKEGRIRLNALVAHPNGTRVLRETGEGDDPVRLGEEVGDTLLRRGGDVILEEVYGEGFALPQQP